MANHGENSSGYHNLYQGQHQHQHQQPPPSAMAALDTDDYDPFEMRAEQEDEFTSSSPRAPHYPRATSNRTPDKPAATSSSTSQQKIYTTAAEIPALDTPALEQHHHRHHNGEKASSSSSSPLAKVTSNLRKRYSGRWAWYDLRRVFLPRYEPGTDPEAAALRQASQYDEAVKRKERKGSQVVKRADGKYEYYNQYHEPDYKFVDTAVYLSPTGSVPRRLVVQATSDVLARVKAGAHTGDWIRTRIRGDVPFMVTLSEWALRPLDKHGWWNKLDAGLRVLAISLPLQAMLVLPGFSGYDDDADIADSYTDHPGYHWDWPKYATNVLDEAPGSENGLKKRECHGIDNRRRARKPKKIVVREGDTDKWILRDAADYLTTRYVFISYCWDLFVLPEKDQEGNPIKDKARIQRMAQAITLKMEYNAYWLDDQCMSELAAGQKRSLDLDYDVYTMCDVVRGSAMVAILLGEDSMEARRSWGERLWTLPEGLLAPGDTLTWCHETANGTLDHDQIHKIEMASTFWEPAQQMVTGRCSEDDWPIRILAEHFSGVLPLTRLELLPTIVNALAARNWKNVSRVHSDMAYAVMGFLHHRIERNEDDSLFQSLARLSLGNDSDHIVERMISFLPDHKASSTYAADRELDNSGLFRDLFYRDQFSTRVHDITPICDVVGVAYEDDTVIIDNCRAIYIRWKDFKRAQVQRSDSTRRVIAGFFVAAGLWWLNRGLSLAFYWLPYWVVLADLPYGNYTESVTTDQATDINEPQATKQTKQTKEDPDNTYLLFILVGFLAVAVVLSVAAPFSIRRLFGGQLEKSAPNLVAFEGVLSLCKIEKTIFGSNNKRLSWSPSATPLCARKNARDMQERLGLEPTWAMDPNVELPPGHHLFTLVDTGDLTATIFLAERPPTVALLCGREGGMVRATLCSWRFENDCLYKETVIRVPSTVYEKATHKDWLKLCLISQDQAKWRRARMRLATEKGAEKAPAHAGST